MRNVLLLALAQAFAACGTLMLVTFGGIVGVRLAPTPALATLPLSLAVTALALSSVPAARLMQRFGRRPMFAGSALLAIMAALGCAAAILSGSFAGFALAAAVLGVNMAFVQQYRFAAAEYVEPAETGRAIATVMLGTLVAAVLAPQIGDRARGLLGVEFAGSFVALGGLLSLAVALLLLLDAPQSRLAGAPRQIAARPVRSLAAQPAFVVAVLGSLSSYAVMSLVMTATPISMHVVDGISVAGTERVISTHLVAMYLPSLASGWLVRSAGVERMMYAGIGCMASCIGIDAWVGHHFTHYLAGLALLGVGWNLMFVAATTLLTSSYLPQERFRAQGINDFATFGSQALASLLAGVALQRLGWQNLNLTALPMLLVLLGAMFWWRGPLAAGRSA